MEGRGARRTLLAILVVSFGLRVFLASSGGQRFFPDENRYLRCFQLLRHLGTGSWRAAADLVVTTPDHVGFLLVGLPAAAVQRAVIRLLDLPDTRASIDATAWIPAVLLGLASCLCVLLVHAIARRAGASVREAETAAFLMASSTVLLVYSRHLLSYDSALLLALLALYLGLSEHSSPRRSFFAGLVGGMGFLTYNGYWLIVAAALGVHVFFRASARGAARRAIAAFIGLSSLPFLLTVAGLVLDRGLYIRRLLRFSRGAATQTDFSEGWSLPLAYLWHAEHGLLILLILGTAAALVLRIKGEAGGGAHGPAFAIAALAMYGTTIVLSNGLERIGAFGRHARSAVPFLCLATAWALERILHGRPRLRAATLTLVAAQAVFNFWAPLTLRYPRSVLSEMEALYGPLGRDTTVTVDPSPEERPSPEARYVLLNARYLYPIYGPKAAPTGRVLYETPHPLTYRPYQYEGYVPAERVMIRDARLTIRLLDTRPD